jgi:hypothetical protein
MKLGILFTVNAVIAAVFGCAFIVAPVQLLLFYGVGVTPGTVVVSRLFGAALFGYGSLTWQVRVAAPSDALRAIVLSLFVADGIGFFASLQGVLSGAVNAMGWSTVVLYGALCAAFGYFLFAKPAGSAAPR